MPGGPGTKDLLGAAGLTPSARARISDDRAAAIREMMRPRRFRFGLLGESIHAATELVDTARRAEGAGFATFLLRDHFIEEPFGHQLAPLTALATAAAATWSPRELQRHDVTVEPPS
jgi:hypothetical protein